jgi:hypothetical protein
LIAANSADLRQLQIAGASTIYLAVLDRWSMIFLYLKFVSSFFCSQPAGSGWMTGLCIIPFVAWI